MKGHKILIGFLVGVVPLASYLLLPGFDERLAMLMRAGHEREAAAELEREITSGDKRPSILAALGRAYNAEVSGKLGRAIEIMETYVSHTPRDPEGFRVLAGLYAAANRPHAMVTAQALLVAVSPARADVARLLGLYRLYGRFDEERKLLLEMQNQPALESADLLRLGELLAAKGERAAAVDVLTRADDMLGPDEEQTRVLLFELLASSGRSSEAARRAKRWLTNWHKPWLAARFVRRLARGSPDQDLDSLAAVAVALHPETKLYLAQILIENGRRASANRLLSLDQFQARIETGPAPAKEDIAAFLDAVRFVDDPNLIWQAFAAALKNPSAAAARVDLAEALAAQFGYAAISPALSLLPLDALAQKPLFAARLAMQENNPVLARKLLQETDLHKLTPDDQRAWVALMTQSFPNEIVFGVLTSLSARGKLPITLLPAYAALAARLGHDKEYIFAIAELDRL
jgi:hypothetical protein